ncbi:FABP family protein [Cellulomonas dongxiuzhuiae]|uniref:Ferric nitrobindin-like protein n=1 Tax=Cellulomonas dongxiuzhuiae TaxID=2819979 RepID=A0ABX8GIB0_9CELL|nr:FABP family protein [Cellulomonas dongxiuzhuiae]MBO3087985.1 FABP family protein [Cellulomonas dongxiuzhuiae]MBO3094663.1 FABP family protein [Cellulomonas dongxiuzhuiae]QWC15670.1 FABP family protein [Cellulomonas dongxiuzhuiae]
MPFVLPEGLAPEVYPLAWLVGRWRGEGVVGYPGIEESAFTQELEITHDGGPYLAYRTTVRLVVAPDDVAAIDLDASGDHDPDAPPQDVPDVVDAPVWTTESGYWRVPPERPAGLTADQHPVELLVADPAGYVAVYVGSIGNGRVDLASDLIAHTATGAAVNAGKRLYGLVEGDLMWAHDIAAFGEPMQSYASARLSRVEG